MPDLTVFDIEAIEEAEEAAALDAVLLPECLWVDAVALDSFGEPREPCGLCQCTDDHGLPRVVRARLDPARRLSACLACALGHMFEFLPLTH